MDEKNFSTRYDVRKLQASDLALLFALCRQNTFYYQHCPPFVTENTLLEDMKKLPPAKTLKDKYYVGFFDGTDLVAVMDFIDRYPTEKEGFIGFFMVAKDRQGKGLGGFLVEEFLQYLKTSGYKGVRLGFVETNHRAENFWKTHGFREICTSDACGSYRVVIAKRRL